jgi:hypothetical protein
MLVVNFRISQALRLLPVVKIKLLYLEAIDIQLIVLKFQRK